MSLWGRIFQQLQIGSQLKVLSMRSSFCSSVSALDDHVTLHKSFAYIKTTMSTFGKKCQHYIWICSNINITLLRRTCCRYSRKIHDVYLLSRSTWEESIKTNHHCTVEMSVIMQSRTASWYDSLYISKRKVNKSVVRFAYNNEDEQLNREYPKDNSNKKKFLCHYNHISRAQR